MALRYKYKQPLILFLCAFVSLWFIGSSCKNHNHPDKKIFHYNESSGLASLDPAFAKNKQVMWSTHQLYKPLKKMNGNRKSQQRWQKNGTFLKTTWFLLLF